MLGFTKPGWETDTEGKKFIGELVLEVIQLFGTKRCMFASNYPAEGLGASLEAIYGSYREIAANLTREEQRDLFYETADRVYRFNQNSKI